MAGAYRGVWVEGLNYEDNPGDLKVVRSSLIVDTFGQDVLELNIKPGGRTYELEMIMEEDSNEHIRYRVQQFRNFQIYYLWRQVTDHHRDVPQSREMLGKYPSFEKCIAVLSTRRLITGRY